MASYFTFDFNSVSEIVVDAVGPPGQRTFLLQARQGGRMASLIMEKQQVAALATSILQLLEELEKEHPDLPMLDESMSAPPLQEPVDVAFRVGQLGLGYDANQDMMVLIAQAMPESDDDPDEQDNLLKARFYATRAQMYALSKHALDVVAAGRPECPLCGQPMDPQGHFCPRTNGHAVPLSI